MGEKILIVDDEPFTSSIMKYALNSFGFEFIDANDGDVALDILLKPESPRLVLLDWVMPKITGIEVLREIRKVETNDPPYIIMVTNMANKEYVIEALDEGADDYLTKPFHGKELVSRVKVGIRVIELRNKLSVQTKELSALQELISICSCCKKISSKSKLWTKLEEYVLKHSDAQFAHGICHGCHRKEIENT